MSSWPWFAVAGLGLYHGLNPAMGWLFAAALGLHRQSRAVVLWSLMPIALGHAAAIMLAVVAMTLAGSVLNLAWLRALTGIGLVGWALYHLAYGARHRVRIGMQTGAMGLAVWSFLMANAHGAGMMIVPALIPLCLSGAQSAGDAALGAPLLSLTVVALHTATLLTTAGVIAMIVYDWVGVGFLRRGWINLDRIWAAALVGTGLILLVP